jgi:hypothetical protein
VSSFASTANNCFTKWRFVQFLLLMASDAEEVVADPAVDEKCYVTGPCVRCDFDEEVIRFAELLHPAVR